MLKSVIMPNKSPCICTVLILIFLLMLFSPVVITADAAGITTEASTWSALQEAFGSATSGDTIRLTGNVTAAGSDKMLTIPDGLILILDLNGHTIDRALKENGGTDGVALCVNSGSILTITDSSAAASGMITGGYASNGGGIRNYGTLILEGGYKVLTKDEIKQILKDSL